MWFSVVCILIDNEYGSPQWSKFFVDSLGCNLSAASLRPLSLSTEAVKKGPRNEADSAVTCEYTS